MSRITKTTWRGAALAAVLLSGAMMNVAHAAESTPAGSTPVTSAAPAPNPALAKFGEAITFYASFDQSATADLSNGDGQSVDVASPIKLQPGLRGQAFLAGQGGQRFFYQNKDNLDLTKPGAVAVWISPQQWQRDPEKIPTFPIFSATGYGQWLLLARMGNKVNEEVLYAYNKAGDNEVTVTSGNSLNWKDGEWHLLVCNWRDDSIAFSLDGAAPHRVSAPWRAQATGEPGKFYVGTENNYSDPTILQRYLVDELMVFNRPLTTDEIIWLYTQLKPATG